MSKLKNRKEFEGGLHEKRKEKEEERKKVIKHTLKYRNEAYMTAKNPQKQGRILKGGEYFSGWPEYIPLVNAIKRRRGLTIKG